MGAQPEKVHACSCTYMISLVCLVRFLLALQSVRQHACMNACSTKSNTDQLLPTQGRCRLPGPQQGACRPLNIWISLIRQLTACTIIVFPVTNPGPSKLPCQAGTLPAAWGDAATAFPRLLSLRLFSNFLTGMQQPCYAGLSPILTEAAWVQAGALPSGFGLSPLLLRLDLSSNQLNGKSPLQAQHFTPGS